MGVEQWLKIFLKKTANSKYTGKGGNYKQQLLCSVCLGLRLPC